MKWVNNLILFLIVVTGCKKTQRKIYGDYAVCDTCKTRLIIEYVACTSCMDFEVDSGIVNIGHNLMKQWDSISPNMKEDILCANDPRTLTVWDMYFDDRGEFEILWPLKKGADGEKYWDDRAIYRVEGYVSALKYHDPYWAFHFHITKYQRLSRSEEKKYRRGDTD